ncbi:Putative acetyltransferase [Streptococcus constellatus]|uniref:Acetyltransferase n=1 Tax=Streptococcus constellatus TaxID=76860 RepID=A0A564TYL9_STRCV|nr:sugar O-acetyltransferase [Streptococcus constellatus]VUX02890.1 Putative acetyltransferase [Streptococcus gordonii]VUX12330.1 Putative acetyltransferase [Streptococcus constellatus]
MTDLLNKLQSQKEILPGDALLEEIHRIKHQNEVLISELNTGFKTEKKVRGLIAQITGQPIDPSVSISLPFQTDFGHHIHFGKDIFINKEAFFVDLGGITIEDKVMIGPRVMLVTVNHMLEPKKRRGMEFKPILIKKNAWLGAGVTVLPGVTIGENAVIAANSTVTKNVPANTIVAGTPARVIREIENEVG